MIKSVVKSTQFKFEHIIREFVDRSNDTGRSSRNCDPLDQSIKAKQVPGFVEKRRKSSIYQLDFFLLLFIKKKGFKESERKKKLIFSTKAIREQQSSF